MKRLPLVVTLAAALAGAPGVARAQPQPADRRGAVALAELVDGLGVTGRVLIIGAHPDDEDTRLIAWLARGRHVETAYLSLTRGDGGQNLIGNELGEALGAIRTEELLAARRIDGAHQYFTRAYDFGFSKNASEAFRHWPHDSLMNDVVTVVRAFRPQIIVAIFTGTPRDGHGQHQVSGILAREAYETSGDTVRYPVKRFGPAWSASKFYRSSWFAMDSATYRFDAGEYSPLLGRSYAEIAAESRSQHRSQAMGQLQRKGPSPDGLRREASRVGPADARAERDLFDGIDSTWGRLGRAVPVERAHVESVQALIAEVRGAYRFERPEGIVLALGRLHAVLAKIDSTASSRSADLARTAAVTERRVTRAFLLASGVSGEGDVPRDVLAVTPRPAHAGVGTPPVDTLPVRGTLFNGGSMTVSVQPVQLPWTGGPSSRRVSSDCCSIAPGSAWADVNGSGSIYAPTWHHEYERVGDSLVYTQPWWLTAKRVGDLFGVQISGIAEDERSVSAAALDDKVAGGFSLTMPLMHRYADPARGEVDRPLAFVPAVSVTLDRYADYAPANAALDRPLRVFLRSGLSRPQQVRVSLALPAGLQADSTTRVVALAPFTITSVDFRLRGTPKSGRQRVSVSADADGARFTSGYTLIDYEHIRPQRIYHPATLDLEAVDVKVPPYARIAYIQGVGDNSMPALRALGLDVVALDPARLASTDLSGFTAVVVGTRAYESSPDLVAHNARLLEYVRNGGTMVVQYGQYEMQNPGMMPYPIALARPAARVTDENAPVRVTDPASPLLNAPNRITAADFAGWVQDRTYYMPSTWDPHYHTLLSTNDPGEPANESAILVTPYGRGTYVYTTLAFFRQLPEGVPGAARLFVNLLAAGQGSRAAAQP